jgi:hypothetical protein
MIEIHTGVDSSAIICKNTEILYHNRSTGQASRFEGLEREDRKFPDLALLPKRD